MTLLWMDGFDHYGGSMANLTDGAYAELVNPGSGAPSITTSNPATGTHAWRYPMSWTPSGRGVRLVLSATSDTIGIGGRWRLDSIPGGDNAAQLFQIRNASNVAILSIGVQANGSISVKRGNQNGTEIGNSGTFKLTAGIYQHIEAKAYIDASAGTVEVRVDGITRVNVAGVNSGTGPAGQIFLGGSSIADYGYCQVDDFFVWSNAGSSNNDFLGPKGVYLQMPNQDTAVAGMTPVGSATGYGAVNSATPDGDTSYLQAASALTTELELTDLPAEVTGISAIMLLDRSRKTDSGNANVRKSLLSGASVAAGADNVVATAYAFRFDIVETDPATGAPMTPSAFNAAKLRLARTV